MDKQINIVLQDCTWDINLTQFFAKSGIKNIKRLFNYTFAEHWRNTEAISVLDEFLSEMVNSSKERWIEACKKYYDNYVEIGPYYFMGEKNKMIIYQNNQKLVKNLKKTEKDLECYTKILDLYLDIKSKNL